MDLRRPPYLTDLMEDAYNFLRDSQLCRIMLNPSTLRDTLDEYIFYMNESYNMYNDRIKVKSLAKKRYTENIANFEKLTQGGEISKEEKIMVIKFYEELLDHVDKILKEKYYLGRKFTKEEAKSIETTDLDREMNNVCEYKRIVFYVCKNIFNKMNFIKYNHRYSYTDLMGDMRKIDSYYVVEFNSDHTNFCYCHIDNVLYSCKQPVSFKIDYDLTTNDELFIVVDPC